MQDKILLQGATLVNEGVISRKDVLIKGERILMVEDTIKVDTSMEVIDITGKYLIPGVIDDQVHFREPGLVHKGCIASESAAAVAGGVTSFIDQPNTVPNTITQALLADKYALASNNSKANYGFMMGGTNDNLDEVLKTDGKSVPGIKLFLGSSTGNMLVDNPEVLENIFSQTPLLIAVHCEDESTIKANLQKAVEKYGDKIPMSEHPSIRSAEACYISSSKAVELARKTGAQLHVFHVSTEKELQLFDNTKPLKDKKITAEVCVHHLHFTDDDYATKGSFIKWNPAVKKSSDREALWEAVRDGRIDVIATDHAPHTLEEKSQNYLQAPSGGPLVQHSLMVMWDYYKKGKITLDTIVEKMCHNPATLFKIKDRGYVRPGFYADLVVVDPQNTWRVDRSNIRYQCGWSPLEGTEFSASVLHTMVNGQWAVWNQELTKENLGQRLLFNR